MSKLKKCGSCNVYTLNDICPKCKNKENVKDAHYKFVRIRSIEKNFNL